MRTDPDPVTQIIPELKKTVLGIRGILMRIRLLPSVTLRMQKNIFFSFFFLITYPQAHLLQSLIYCFKDKFCVNILFLQALFQSAQHI
jgi:hypothetical protein